MHRHKSCWVCPILRVDQTRTEILRKLLQKGWEPASLLTLPWVSTSLPVKFSPLLPGIICLINVLTYKTKLKLSSEKLFHESRTNLRSGKTLEKIGQCWCQQKTQQISRSQHTEECSVVKICTFCDFKIQYKFIYWLKYNIKIQIRILWQFHLYIHTHSYISIHTYMPHLI